jgi:biotin operon repressor
MNGTKGQMSRWIEILEILKASKRPVSLWALARDLGVCEKTILRDLQYLKDVYGAPIAKQRNTGAVTLTEAAFVLKTGMVSASQLEKLVMAEVLLDAMGLIDISKDVSGLIKEIGCGREAVLDNNREGLKRSISKETAGKVDGGGLIGALMRAFGNGRSVRLHLGRGSDSCWLNLHAGRLVLRDNAFYVTGNWEGNIELDGHVALSRIDKVMVYRDTPALPQISQAA